MLARKIAPVTAPAQGLHGHTQRMRETDRIHDMPAVHGMAMLGLIHAIGPDDLMHPQKRCGVRHILAVDIPIIRTTKIIFRTGTADRWKLRIIVDIKFDLAFAPPAAMV